MDETNEPVPTLNEIDEIENILEEEAKKGNTFKNKKKKKVVKKKKKVVKRKSDIPEPGIDEDLYENPISEPQVKLPETSTSTPRKTAPVNSRRPSNKQETVAELMKLQELVDGYIPQSKSWYMRKTVPQLEIIFGDLVQRATNQAQGIPNPPPGDTNGVSVSGSDAPEQPETQINVENAEPYRQPHQPKVDAGSTLFHLNIIVSQFCEAVSINYEDKLGTSLKGFTDDVVAKQRELESILAEIYAENSEMLDPMLSGTNKYFLTMIGIASQRLVINKKKSPSGEEDA